jgi:hypothetical protein
MRVLLDSGVWFRHYHGLPVSPALRHFLTRRLPAC